MADTAAAPRFTDEELSFFATHASEEDLAKLSQDERDRMETLLAPPPAAPAPTPVPVSEPPAAPVEAAPAQPAPESPATVEGAQPVDLAFLRGRLAQLPMAPQITLPENIPPVMSNSTYAQLRPGPPLPPEQVPFVQRLIDAANRPFESENSRAIRLVRENSGENVLPMETAVSSPERVAKESGAERATQTLRTLTAGQPSETLPGSDVGPPEAKRNDAMLSELAKGIAVGTVESYAETIGHPVRQLTEHPVEFAMNVAPVVLPLVSKLLAGAGKGEAEVAQAAERLAAEKPTLSTVVQSGVEKEQKAQDVAAEMAQIVSGNDDLLARLGALRARTDKLKDGLVEGSEAAAKADPFVPPPVPEAFHVEPAAMTEAEAILDTAKADKTLRLKLGASAIGAGLLAENAQAADPNTPEDKTGGLLSVGMWVGGAVAAYGAWRFFRSAGFRKATANVLSLTKDDPNFEPFFREFFAPFFPDKPANGALVRPALTLAGAGAGALVGSHAGEDQTSVAGGIVGGALGAMMGARFGGALTKMFQTDATMRQIYEWYFTETAGMTPEMRAAKDAFRTALSGRIQEIKDVATRGSKFPIPVQEAMDNFLRGVVGPMQLPKAARETAVHMRIIFDELTTDMLKVGLVKDKVLRDTLVSNLGTYLPRLYLRWEQADQPLETVTAWLRSQGKGLQALSDRNYLKNRKDIPQAVRDAWGEITDNPSYLLAKRGVVTASDIELARYQRFIASSPDWTLSDKLVRQQRRVNKIQKSLIAGGGQVAQPPSIRFYRGAKGSEFAEMGGKTFWRMPQDAKYGVLSGKYVEQSLAFDLRGMHDVATGMNKFMQASVGVFKAFKVALNPATLFRNVVGNFLTADVVGGLPVASPYWARAVKEYATKGDFYKQAVRAGALGGEYYPEEIQALLHRAGTSENFFSNKLDWVLDMSQKPFDKMGGIHQMSEQVSKLAVYMRAVEKRGLAAPDAAALAQKAVGDFRNVPRWVQWERTSVFGSPFVSYSYKFFPRAVEAAIAGLGDPIKAWRFWKYPLAIGAANEYAARKFNALEPGEDTGVIGTIRRIAAGGLGLNYADRWQKYLPDYSGPVQILMPFRDSLDRYNHTDVTWYLPWGQWQDLGKGQVGKWFNKMGLGFPSQLEPSHPFAQVLAAAMTGGKDPFTGKSVVKIGSEPADGAIQTMQYVMRTFGPALLNPAGGSYQKLERSLSGDYSTDPNTPTLGQAVGSEILGFKMRPVDPRQAFAMKAVQLRGQLNEARANVVAAARDLGRTDLSDEELMTTRADPRSAFGRALSRYRGLVTDFRQKYGDPSTLPPTPQKLLDAINRRRKKTEAK